MNVRLAGAVRGGAASLVLSYWVGVVFVVGYTLFFGLHVKVPPLPPREREIFTDNLLVRVHFIIKMSRPALRHGSLISLFHVAPPPPSRPRPRPARPWRLSNFGDIHLSVTLEADRGVF